MDIARSEVVDAELERLIQKRAQQRRKDGELTASQQAATWREEFYAESVRRYNAEHAEARLWMWRTYHQRAIRAQKAIFTALVASHERELSRIEVKLDQFMKGE